jgi:hypothetical protein
MRLDSTETLSRVLHLEMAASPSGRRCLECSHEAPQNKRETMNTARTKCAAAGKTSHERRHLRRSRSILDEGRWGTRSRAAVLARAP